MSAPSSRAASPTGAATPGAAAGATAGTSSGLPPILSGSTPSMRISNVYSNSFGMPFYDLSGGLFDGTNWNEWSGTLEAILTLHEAEDVFYLMAPPQ
ncbi:hypothetical protein EDB84DRAFT_1564011 [Lactarius hengduanensis]|nr:hypothetical protein EDB84DRAFT_1564011 [Lactarius hengduanensis]